MASLHQRGIRQNITDMADWVFDGDRSRDLTDELSFEDSPSFYANSIFSETAVDKMDEIKVILWTSFEGKYGGSDP